MEEWRKRQAEKEKAAETGSGWSISNAINTAKAIEDSGLSSSASMTAKPKVDDSYSSDAFEESLSMSASNSASKNTNTCGKLNQLK